LPVWIYQFKIAPHPTFQLASTPAERDASAERFADAVTAIWDGRIEVDRFNELVMRARLTWQQVVLLRAYAKYLRQVNFPYSQSYIESVLNEYPATARSLVTLFEALFDPSSGSSVSGDAQAAAAAVAADIDALVSLDTDRILRAFASLVQATLRTNYFVTRQIRPAPATCWRSSSTPSWWTRFRCRVPSTRYSCIRLASRACT